MTYDRIRSARSRADISVNGPNATGKHCPEGCTLYRLPGPQLGGIAHSGVLGKGKRLDAWPGYFGHGSTDSTLERCEK